MSIDKDLDLLSTLKYRLRCAKDQYKIGHHYVRYTSSGINKATLDFFSFKTREEAEKITLGIYKTYNNVVTMDEFIALVEDEITKLENIIRNKREKTAMVKLSSDKIIELIDFAKEEMEEFNCRYIGFDPRDYNCNYYTSFEDYNNDSENRHTHNLTHILPVEKYIDELESKLIKKKFKIAYEYVTVHDCSVSAENKDVAVKKFREAKVCGDHAFYNIIEVNEEN
jgi:hypothetical protein